MRYDTIMRHIWVMAASRNFAFKIAAKPLQMETWLLMTGYRNCVVTYTVVSDAGRQCLLNTLLLAHWSARQKLNHVSSVQFSSVTSLCTHRESGEIKSQSLHSRD